MFDSIWQRSPTWSGPPQRPALREDEVHLWLVPLQIAATEIDALMQILSSDERVRATRFHFARDQRRFIAARGTLKRILGKYLGLAPQEVEFRYGPHGKPTIHTQAEDGALRFNLSHAHELALVAVTHAREVGVDIEHSARAVDANGIVERFFASHEQTMYESVAPGERQELFLRYWTCKEAFAKATGQGLSLPLKQIEILLTPESPARLASTVDDAPSGRRWTLQELRPSDEQFGALVVEGAGDFKIEFWQAP
ncbi:MAG: 4'-phosphopantetheinyl transferase superfamily protein [Caldilineaceae bacterium]|nr:4'-phosphopantetheinyl transferase superfamily protein [Caldilineaceae bacterium]